MPRNLTAFLPTATAFRATSVAVRAGPCLPDVDLVFEAQWARRQREFTDYMRSRLSGRWKWIPNVGALITSRDPSDHSNADGVMVEGFSGWGGGRHFAVSDWVLQMNRSLALINVDKILIAQTSPTSTDPDERLFVLASYLLIKGAHTYVNLEKGLAPEWFPEYGVDLGKPLGSPPPVVTALRDSTWDVYVRQYEKGIVAVNPRPEPRTIQLDRARYLMAAAGGGQVPPDGRAPGSLSYTQVTRVTLGGYRAAVLLNASP